LYSENKLEEVLDLSISIAFEAADEEVKQYCCIAICRSTVRWVKINKLKCFFEEK
jgi:hypothetical protein